VLSQSEVLSIPLEANSNLMEAGDKVFLSFEEAQRQHIIKALRKTDGRVTGPHGAGVLLGLNDRTLVSKMRKLDIRKVEYLIN
jgi:transcriptional regulator with GAF, ATPase, and Fis domain